MNLNNNQLQVLLSGVLGDGHLTTPITKNSNSSFTTCCKYSEYIDMKSSLLESIVSRVVHIPKNGYAKTPIYRLDTQALPIITEIKNLSIEEILNQLTPLGVALWIYDDGSLHKDKLFYNINTHAFNRDVQENLFIPFLQKLGINAKLTIENKKDGRRFWYLRVSRFEGAFEISEILNKYYIKCYDYKIWSTEARLSYRKLQVELKRRGVQVSNKRFGNLLKCSSTQEMVQSLERSKAGIISECPVTPDIE